MATHKDLFTVGALYPGSQFVFVAPAVESGRTGTIEGVVIGPGVNEGVEVRIVEGIGRDRKARVVEWSARTYVRPLTTAAVRF